ncbi:hypothetical protein POSPLADRAFT_1048238 [Postia placenta MAD-698-R-SB12]|uniref:Uncharacterized protein n=1 Tax=Postia placenta MAD-698-R-SB12 TaxID=670580 RepID=A0A1X6MTV5_9APHY|nr:hypothetical protein POSPLADRAFT_1048238 [Postia placenta MAD-698-R-SB12]OSX59759.1 hypothetical protein POSPLADRAFT_1048238 [Postia placenta MAD-698-R-SB12]
MDRTPANSPRGMMAGARSRTTCYTYQSLLRDNTRVDTISSPRGIMAQVTTHPMAHQEACIHKVHTRDAIELISGWNIQAYALLLLAAEVLTTPLESSG